MTNLKHILIMITLGLFVGCMAIPKAPAATGTYSVSTLTGPVPTVVLPFANETTDLAAGGLARLLFALGLQEKGYEVFDVSATDSLLLTIGISDGGQLGAVTTAELQKLFGVDALLYGNILQAEYSTKGFTSKKEVKIGVRIVLNGTEVWKAEDSHKTGGGLSNPLSGLAKQIVDKTFEKAFSSYAGHPLETEIETVVYKLQAILPGTREEESGWN